MARRMSSPVMVGRDGVVAQLQATLATSNADEPRHVVVGGEAGVGKTRLVSRVAELAGEDGARVLVGGCVSMGASGLPYAPYAEIIRALISQDGAPRVASFAGRAAPDLARLVPELGLDDAPVAQETWARSRLYEALLGVFRHLATRTAVVLMIEDVHWADAETLAATSFLMRAVQDEPISIIVTFRSLGDARRPALRAWLADIARNDHVERIDLEPLSEADLVPLVRSIVGEELGPSELADIYERSDGNPFFVEELLASRRDISGALPSSLRDVLLARVETLGASARSLIEVAAVGGRTVEHELLITVADRPSSDAAEDLGSLVDAGLLVPTTGLGGDDAYSFRHALVQEAVYDAILPAERRRLHRAWAEVLLDRGGTRSEDPAHLVGLAHHWRAARDPRALLASIEAGDAAMAGFSAEIAHNEYEAALAIWDADTIGVAPADMDIDLATLLVRTSRAAHLASDYQRAIAASREAIEVLGDGDLVRVVDLQVDLARVLWITGDWGQSIHHYEEALRIAPIEPPMARTRALAGLGQVYMGQGYFQRARPLIEEAIEKAAESGARHLHGQALVSLSNILVNLGKHREARVAIDQGMAIALELGIPEDIGRSYTNLGLVVARGGSLEEALAVSLDGIEVADEYGVSASYGEYLRYAAVEYAFECGKWEEARRQIALSRRDAGLRTSSELYSAYLSVAHLLLEYLVCSGATEATEMWSRVRTMLADQVPSHNAGPMYVGGVQLAAFAGRHQEGAEMAWEGLALLQQTDGWIEIAGLARIAAWPLAEVGIEAKSQANADGIRASEERMDQLLELIERARGFLGRPTNRLGAYIDLLGSQVEGEQARMRGDAEPDRWHVVADGLADLNRPYRALVARWREAQAAYASGDRDRAVMVAREAYLGASDLGAKPLMVQLERLARKMRIHLAAASGDGASGDTAPYGLTSREREVLALVAAGRTNRQIADELFISKSTGGVHVSNILAKLGVSTRAEAGDIAISEGLTRNDG